jgi:VCBS repeat-containing protein
MISTDTAEATMATFNGSNADDTFTGTSANDQFNAGEGNNKIDAGGGNNNVNVGSGNDSITAGNGNDVVNAGEGANLIHAGHGTNIINAGSGADTVYSGTGNDQINVGEGNNYVQDYGGNNIISTGSGADSIWSGAGNDQINAGEGNNLIRAGDGANRVTSGSGTDNIITGSGNDTVYSGSGADTLNLGGGSDLVYMGDGNDVIRHVITDSLGSQDDYWAESGTDTLQLVFTAEQANDSALLADVNAFKASMAKGEWMYTFKSIGLTARQFEKIELIAPVEAHDDSATTDEDTAVILSVLGNDIDLLASNNAALRVTGFDKSGVPEGASLVLNSNGTFTFDPGTAYQHLGTGEQTTLTFTYTVADNQGFTDTATASITIEGKNDLASISGNNTGMVTEDGETQTTSGKLTVSDVDQDQAEFIPVDPADLDTQYGAFTFDPDGNWTFVLDNEAAQSLEEGQVVQQTLTVKSEDGTAEETITVDIVGAAEEPTSGTATIEFTSINSATRHSEDGFTFTVTGNHTDASDAMYWHDFGANPGDNDLVMSFGGKAFNLDSLDIQFGSFTATTNDGQTFSFNGSGTNIAVGLKNVTSIRFETDDLGAWIDNVVVSYPLFT